MARSKLASQRVVPSRLSASQNEAYEIAVLARVEAEKLEAERLAALLAALLAANPQVGIRMVLGRQVYYFFDAAGVMHSDLDLEVLLAGQGVKNSF